MTGHGCSGHRAGQLRQFGEFAAVGFGIGGVDGQSVRMIGGEQHVTVQVQRAGLEGLGPFPVILVVGVSIMGAPRTGELLAPAGERDDAACRCIGPQPSGGRAQLAGDGPAVLRMIGRRVDAVGLRPGEPPVEQAPIQPFLAGCVVEQRTRERDLHQSLDERGDDLVRVFCSRSRVRSMPCGTWFPRAGGGVPAAWKGDRAVNVGPPPTGTARGWHTSRRTSCCPRM